MPRPQVVIKEDMRPHLLGRRVLVATSQRGTELGDKIYWRSRLTPPRSRWRLGPADPPGNAQLGDPGRVEWRDGRGPTALGRSPTG